MNATASKPRKRTRPLTSEWLQMRAMLNRANEEREAVIARAWKWQALIGATAFLVGVVLGKVL